MSKYTTEVRYICENYAGLSESEGGNDVESIVEKSRSKVFDFDFPIFDESYRSVLERKILKHFYTREIGEETVGLWKLRLNVKLNEIMPYYNQLYKSELLEFNPLYTHNLERSYNRGVDGNIDVVEKSVNSGTGSTTNSSNGNVSGTTNEWDKYSDTPQGALTGIESDTYLTNARNISNSDTRTATENSSSGNSYSGKEDNTSNTISKSLEDYVEKVVGYEGASGSKLIKEFRETFLNIDLLVINELDILFMQLW